MQIKSPLRHARRNCVCMRLCLMFLLVGLLGACATSTPPRKVALVVVQSVHPVSRDDDQLLKLIAAEMALQRNDMQAAARGYSDAAESSSDPEVAEQATRLSIAIKQWSLARQSLARWQALAPDAIGVAQANAAIALAEGQFEQAFVALDQLFQRKIENPWRPVGQVLMGAEDSQKALILLRRLAIPEKLGAGDQEWVAMSQLAFKLGDKALASRLASDAVARFKSADALAWSAKLALDQGDKDTARRQYADALKRDPESLQLRSGYAAMLAAERDFAGAARVLAKGPQNDVIYGARAAYSARAANRKLQSDLYRDIQADTSLRSGKRYYLLGQVAELIDKDAQAMEWYAQVPDDDDNWLEAGIRRVVLLDKQGDAAAATARLSELRLGVGVDSASAVQLILLEAEMLERKGKSEQAMAVYSRGIDQFPSETQLLYARAMLAIEHEDLAAGERDLRTIIAADPDSADALNALGYTLADRTDRLSEANELIERALKLKPDEPAILDSHGWVQFRLGNLDEAIKLLRQAFAKQPDGEVAAHLGEALWTRGDKAEARRIWEQGKEKDADDKVLAETVKRLTS